MSCFIHFLFSKLFILLIFSAYKDQSKVFMLTTKNLEIGLDESDEFESHHHSSSSSTSSTTSLDTANSSSSYLVYSPRTHTLNLLVNKIRSILTREKELTASSRLVAADRHVLDAFRAEYIENANFAGANCLLEIFLKRMKMKSTVDMDSKQHHQTSANAFNSSTTSSTSSSAASTSSQTSSPGGRNVSNNIVNDHHHHASESNNNSHDSPTKRYPVRIDELNDKLFLCFLSNFSCRSVENFLLSANQQQPISLLEQQPVKNAAGFLRKHKRDRTFSYLTNSHALDSHDFALSKFKFTFRFVIIQNKTKIIILNRIFDLS